MTCYLIEFHYRSDGGPMRVGTFPSVLEAELHIQRLSEKEDVGSEWDIVPVFEPQEARS